jgi:hypothetical protein
LDSRRTRDAYRKRFEPAFWEKRVTMKFETLRFCSNRLYQNKYEMYEWIQEAIVKGMTDVHEIQRYARQKEISLYGA